jgi:EpsI family protein
MSLLRLFVVALVLLGGIFEMHNIKPPMAPPDHRQLQNFPATISPWHSKDLPFDAQDIKEIGVDDYTNREYLGAGPPIELYIGYYQDQRSGDAIHSPKNCLPGSGWEPIRSTRLQIGSAENPAFVNEYIVEKGRSRDLVLYWYQTHERIIASEYMAKFWMVADGVRNRRTDGAMIRIWTTAADGEERAQARAADFARRIYPQVTEFLPI